MFLVVHSLVNIRQDYPVHFARGQELYDLSQDLGESRDLSTEMPEVTKKLHDELMAFLEEVNAEIEYTDRWDAFNIMKKQHGIDSAVFVPLDYSSPFPSK